MCGFVTSEGSDRGMQPETAIALIVMAGVPFV